MQGTMQLTKIKEALDLQILLFTNEDQRLKYVENQYANTWYNITFVFGISYFTNKRHVNSKTSNIYHVFNHPFRPVLLELHASVMTYRSCQKITHNILFINDHGLYICYNNVYIITLPLCVILRVENVILPRDFCYRNGHALALTNDVSW